MHRKREIAEWWAEHPMTYGLRHGAATYPEGEGALEVPFGSREFFLRADQQLLEWNHPLHDATGPFGRLFPYAAYRGRPVLEIGCGLGGMALLWAQQGARLTAVDLNALAVEQTRRRFAIFNVCGAVVQGDASGLPFRDAAFEYVYSWGVLHHSPDLERSVSELLRVLVPGGRFGVMLYNRHSIFHAYRTLYLEGFLHGERRFLGSRVLASRYGDGHREAGNPHTWPVTAAEVRRLFARRAAPVKVKVLGTDLDSALQLLLPGWSALVPRIVRKAWARRWGWTLWVSGRKASRSCAGS